MPDSTSTAKPKRLCLFCKGSGSISYGEHEVQTCDFCHGEGELPGLDEEPCARCGRDKRDHTDHEFETQAEVDDRLAAFLLAARSEYDDEAPA